MSDKLDELMENEVSVDLEKRKFMNKFGKYAAVSVGMAALMTPNASASFNSGCKPRKPRKQCGGGGNNGGKRCGSGGQTSSHRSGSHSNGGNHNNPHRIRP